ncbi:MAG: alpha/beta fold hydrolase [Fibrobacterota bacterium]
MANTYYRRPYSLQQEETAFHVRDPKTGIILGAEPFRFAGGSGEAVLMLHGYTSTPRDLRALGSSLHDATGHTVSGILLPGHGTRPTELDAVTWPEWYAAAEEEYLKLSRQHSRVHVVGFSMGGALALHLAAHHELSKVVLLSPFFKIAYNACHLVPEEWLVYTIGRLLRHLKKTHSGNCNDAEARKFHIAYYHYALSSIHQALELVKAVKAEIESITNPVLILHAKGDMTTSPSASRRFFNKIPSTDKRFVWLYKSNHIITHDFEKDFAAMETIKFFQER